MATIDVYRYDVEIGTSTAAHYTNEFRFNHGACEHVSNPIGLHMSDYNFQGSRGELQRRISHLHMFSLISRNKPTCVRVRVFLRTRGQQPYTLAPELHAIIRFPREYPNNPFFWKQSCQSCVVPLVDRLLAFGKEEGLLNDTTYIVTGITMDVLKRVEMHKSFQKLFALKQQE